MIDLIDERFYGLALDQTGEVTLGVSGTRHATAADFWLVRYALGLVWTIARPTYLVHGGCKGVDDLCGKALPNIATAGYHTHAIYPHGYQRSSWIVDGDYNTSHEVMPPSTSMLDRDQEVVNRSHCLLALPMYPEAHIESKRSGTWATIRMARRKRIPVLVIPLRVR